MLEQVSLIWTDRKSNDIVRYRLVWLFCVYQNPKKYITSWKQNDTMKPRRSTSSWQRKCVKINVMYRSPAGIAMTLIDRIFLSGISQRCNGLDSWQTSSPPVNHCTLGDDSRIPNFSGRTQCVNLGCECISIKVLAEAAIRIMYMTMHQQIEEKSQRECLLADPFHDTVGLFVTHKAIWIMGRRDRFLPMQLDEEVVAEPRTGECINLHIDARA